jgi:hypothetical protein
MRLATTVLTGLITYESAVVNPIIAEETITEKH